MSELVIITGLSGAGRTESGRVLEDLGWSVFDGIPPSLIAKFAELVSTPGASVERIAIGVVAGREVERLRADLAALRKLDNPLRVLYLEAADEVLVRRYESTRRPHPYAVGHDLALGEAIAQERAAQQALRADADIVIDTTSLNVHELRDRLVQVFATDTPEAGMHVRVISFGFKHGLPLDVDLVLDCRFLPNPHWIDELRPQTGLDRPVADYVLGQEVAPEFLRRVEDLLTLLMPQYVAEGKSYLSIALGCTGGRHRSVVMAEQVAAILHRLGYEPRVTHRDIGR